ncbi:MAG: TlpA family protein disulfide reductase [Gammaproteobacteria bacterium]|nr:TlpA family protein disulfide reductase [Gammaproteobacteria bacterium]
MGKKVVVSKYRVALLLLGSILMKSQSLHASPLMPLAENFTLPDIEGQQVSLNDYQGQYVLLNFWATWCKPCVTEMPELEAAHQALKAQGFTVLAINVGESESKIKAFVAARGFTFPIVLDNDWVIAERYGVMGIPTSFYIDPGGRVYRKILGGSLTKESITAQLIEMKTRQ